MTAVLRGIGLHRSYGPTPALRGVDIEVAEGEIVAVTGPSGGGKSTLLHCLAGILRVDSGEVRYRDQDLGLWSEAARSKLRRSDFGVLFQFGQLVPELTAVENVALPLLLAGSGRREAREAATRWLDRFGVADLAEQLPGGMSGGQQQRCAVARALVTEPRVLFADEPTGALDGLTGEQVLSEIVRVVREQGTAVVLVTHEAQIAAYADREVTLRDGKVDPTGLGADFPGVGLSPAVAGAAGVDDGAASADAGPADGGVARLRAGSPGAGLAGGTVARLRAGSPGVGLAGGVARLRAGSPRAGLAGGGVAFGGGVG